MPDADKHPIRNVVIFSLDKTQFIQMLGRVRTIKPKSFDLFVYKYSKEELNYYLSKSIEELIIRLSCDLWDEEEKKINFRNKYFKFVNNGFYDYNDCSIIKLLDTCINLLSMSKYDKELHSIDSFIEECRNKILFNIKTIWKDSHLYSGSLYNLLSNDTSNYIDFEMFFYKTLLPSYFISKIKNRCNQLLSLFPSLVQNSIRYRYSENVIEQFNIIITKLLQDIGIFKIDCIETQYIPLLDYYLKDYNSIPPSNNLETYIQWINTIDINYNIQDISEYNKPSIKEAS